MLKDVFDFLILQSTEDEDFEPDTIDPADFLSEEGLHCERTGTQDDDDDLYISVDASAWRRRKQ